MKEDINSRPIAEAESGLSYSYWLGTFIIRGTVAPRVLLDALGFGVLFIFLLLVSFPIGLMQSLEVDSASTTSIVGGMNPIWIVPLYVMLLAYPLLSLDRIGMELQNPFSPKRIDFLPLDTICTTIERNVLELLHDIEDQPAAAPRPAEVELPPDAEVSQQNENLPADIS
jgi:ion channel-forming bestrophin family protein